MRASNESSIGPSYEYTRVSCIRPIGPGRLPPGSGPQTLKPSNPKSEALVTGTRTLAASTNTSGKRSSNPQTPNAQTLKAVVWSSLLL
eukprot:5305229-Pyramimonas_sp.AAC.1